MIVLTGNGLNERHSELNSKVNQAATDGVPFDDVKTQEEKTDVDRIFKIDLANKYKNIDYIIETLKCGDNVYIIRALKCSWLYDDELSNIINPDYLDQNVLPEMSFKMKRTFLKTIAKHVTDNERAALFYTYCNKIQLQNMAVKFLLYTSEEFKMAALKDYIFFIPDEDMFHIIGNSFTMATFAMDQLQKYKVRIYLRRLCYLYSVSEDQYLDLVEKYILKFWTTGYSSERLGIRISKDIAKKHKNRILSHPSVYLSMINKKMTARHSKPDDANKYLSALLPAKCNEFWDFYKQYEYLFEVIPTNERLEYIRQMFNNQYPEEKFEMNIQFYHVGLYKLMTKEDRESWALKHIEEGLEHFGHGQDFIWYKFVCFEKAYEPIKKYILIAANGDIRTTVVKVLVNSAQSDRDLEALFTYYYQRFVNEMKQKKEMFVDKVLRIHNCFNFDEACWNAFDKIFHSMDVYDNMNAYSCKSEYKLVAIIRNIIFDIELHKSLIKHIDDGVNLYEFKKLTDKLSEEKVEKVYQYMINFHLEILYSYDKKKYNNKVKIGVRKYIHNLLDFMHKYDKTEKDIPEIVMKFVARNRSDYQYNSMFRVKEEPYTQRVSIRDLKQDASVAISKMPVFKQELTGRTPINLTRYLRKLKIYFSNDVALEYVQLYKEILAYKELHEKTSDAAVFGLLLLAKNDDRIDFVTKNVPTEPKIDHVNIDRKLLYLRTAICKFMSVARPVVPLPIVQKYIVGDYLKLCLPTFKAYEANLQPASLIDFVKFLLKSPVSIQKHGIRMAFQCFSIKDLKLIVSDVWKKMKNVSLRLVMYQSVHNKIVQEQYISSQKELFEAFKVFTLEMREDDDNELFGVMLKTQLPHHILGEHIVSSWQVLQTLPKKQIMITFQATVIRNMTSYISLVQQDLVESIVTEHIKNMLIEEQFKNKSKNENHIDQLIEAKWNLTAKYLMELPTKEVLEQKLKVVETLMNECVRLWSYTENDAYVMRSFFIDFIKKTDKSIDYSNTTRCLHGIVILKEMLKHLQEALPLIEIYDMVWYLRVGIIEADTFADGGGVIAEKGSENRLLIFTESINKFASGFTSLVSEFIEEKLYFPSAIPLIKSILTKVTNNLLYNLPFNVKHKSEYIFFVISSKLMEIEKLETYKMALELWPVSYKEKMSSNFIDKVKSSDDMEIKYLLYRNFVTGNNYNSTPLYITYKKSTVSIFL